MPKSAEEGIEVDTWKHLERSARRGVVDLEAARLIEALGHAISFLHAVHLWIMPPVAGAKVPRIEMARVRRPGRDHRARHEITGFRLGVRVIEADQIHLLCSEAVGQRPIYARQRFP